MEEISKSITKMNLTNSLSISKKIVPLNQDPNKVSIYENGDLTKEGIALAIGKAKHAFPEMSNSQLKLLKEMFQLDGFTDQKALHAVEEVIRTHIYNTPPAIANFLQYDRFYLTYAQALEIGLEYCEIADKDRKLWKRK